ncbi:S-layer homology domain-containing protein [Candidatus Peregrinibacteria bacterium]|nr:S-layer homology domain-containing protein [Candidatus Peregrinibacteria bacterium]
MPRNTVQYTFTITNSGTGNSPNAIFTSTLTSGATFSGGSDTYTTSYPSITPNETKTISLSAIVESPPSATVVNTGTVTDDEASSASASAAFVMWQSKSGGTSSASLRQIIDKYFTKKTEEPSPPPKDPEEKNTEDNFIRISEAPPTLKESGDEEALFPKIIYIERKDLANDLEKIEVFPQLGEYITPGDQQKIASLFSDTKPDHVYYKAAVALYNQGVIQGYKDGSLKLDANITREEVAKIIVRASQSKIPGKFTAGFRDAKAKEWYTPYVNFVSTAKIMEGYGGNVFGVGKNITMAETMKVIISGFQLNPNISPNSGKGHWAKPYYDFLRSKNLVSSDFYNSKKWDKPITRGQIFDIIYRTLFMEDGGSDEFVDTIRMSIPVLNMKDVVISRTLLSDASVWARDLAKGGGFYEVPNENGTLIIFAHASSNPNNKNPNASLFKPLVDSLKIADAIELKLNGKNLFFTLESREKARENEIEKIKNAPKDTGLILFTSAEDPSERWIFMGKSASSI